jgi:prepilin-type N-terminal cleavage/methylation domain-containing protein
LIKNWMPTGGNVKNQKGFSLLEIVCVLVIMGVVFAFALPRFIRVNDAADQKVIDHLVANLTSTEKLTWTNFRLAGDYKDDPDLFSAISYNVEDCSWTLGPTITGGTIHCGTSEATLSRSASSRLKPAEWSR